MRRLVAAIVAVIAVVTFAFGGARAEETTTWSPADARINDPADTFGGDPWGVREPVVAINPTDTDTIVAAAIDMNISNTHDLGSWAGAIHVWRSTDAGVTWIDRGLFRGPGAPGTWYAGDPTLVFDANGTLWMGMLADRIGHTTDPVADPLGPTYFSEGGGVWVYRSDDAGETWGDPVQAVARRIDVSARACSFPDKELITVNPVNGELYVAFTMFNNDCPRDQIAATLTTLTAAEDIEVMMVRSTDGGRTWGLPERIWHGYAFGAQPAVGPDGTIYVSFTSTERITPGAAPHLLGTVVEHDPSKLELIVASSSDNGRSWRYERRPMTDPEFHPSESPFAIGGTRIPSISVDPVTGVAHVVWSSFDPLPGFAIHTMRSSDGGVSWSPTRVVSSASDSFMPSVSAEGGVARVIWVSTADLGNSFDIYAAESADGGVTWSIPTKISGAQSRPGELYDYMWLDAEGDRVAAIWTDLREEEPAPAIYVRMGTIGTL